ncbi:hypothetical protein CRG98_047897 [Punica granatum]|uniref:Glycosyl hydrolase family 31 C-terminal domain-containing protein n=1 Tax=Punica granatum TaxID=22663 RepID=A0A2I0HJ01_PUNGR|nr:hypothetical protein CRG98_047897 [Punica granatum]
MLLPYFYTLFREANTSGVPLIRPLWMEFPSDETTFKNDEAFMVGNSLLVQGIFIEQAKHVSVYMPGKESWYDVRTGATYSGGSTHKLEALEESIPAFQRAGTIIPRRDRFRRSSTQMANDPYTLRIIIMGHAVGPRNALVEPDNRNVETEFGPLQLLGRTGPAVLTIRKPGVRVADDWTIKIL